MHGSIVVSRQGGRWGGGGGWGGGQVRHLVVEESGSERG